MSHEKKTPTFHYTGWLIGILLMVYYNALYNWVVCHPLYNPTNQGFFHCSTNVCQVIQVVTQLDSLFGGLQQPGFHRSQKGYNRRIARYGMSNEKKGGFPNLP